MQERLKKHCAHRTKIRSHSPFAARIICGDCGEFYGHKVWHNQPGTERYDVWYCNHRYKQAKTCNTPILRESEIKVAFESAMKQLSAEKTVFNEDRWRTLVETVTVYSDRSMKFLFTDGNKVVVLP
ncbi:MAG: zinc ribbon domain-containing protein [Acutalibacter sp.]|nr:zinc ribbon domain-containing protein [Acutalibacter sp.]